MWKLFSLALLATAAAVPSTVLEGLSSILSIPNLNEHSELQQAIAIIKDVMTYSCYENGKQSAIYTAFVLVLLSAAIEKHIGNGEDSNEIVIVNACRLFQNPAMKEHFENLNSNREQCLPPKYREFHWSPNKTIDIACKNNGEMLIKFDKEGGFNCLNNQKTNISNCLRDSYEVFDSTKGAKNEFIDPEKMCRFLKILKKCLSEQLKNCQSTTTANFVAEVLVYDFPICKQAAAA